MHYTQYPLGKGYIGTMRDWVPTGNPLSPRQLRIKNRPNEVEYIKRVELDGTLFCTTEWSEGKKCDNSYITNHFMDGNQEKLSIGHLHKMFIVYMDPAEEKADCVISGDWYDVIGQNPISRNQQVKYNPNHETESLTFLRFCTAKNITLGKSNPFLSEGDGLYDVLDD
jgi:hypothetical protein